MKTYLIRGGNRNSVSFDREMLLKHQATTNGGNVSTSFVSRLQDIPLNGQEERQEKL